MYRLYKIFIISSNWLWYFSKFMCPSKDYVLICIVTEPKWLKQEMSLDLTQTSLNILVSLQIFKYCAKLWVSFMITAQLIAMITSSKSRSKITMFYCHIFRIKYQIKQYAQVYIRFIAHHPILVLDIKVVMACLKCLFRSQNFIQ